MVCAGSVAATTARPMFSAEILCMRLESSQNSVIVYGFADQRRQAQTSEAASSQSSGIGQVLQGLESHRRTARVAIDKNPKP